MNVTTETLFTSMADIEVRAADGRHELDGICVPYEIPTLKAGPRPEMFHRGAFAALIGQAVGKVRLIGNNHDTNGRPVAVMTAAEERAGGLWGRFRFYNTRPGRDAFEEVAEGTYGGLSVGFRVAAGGERIEAGMRHIDAAALHHVSLADEPAYDGATILDVRSASLDEFAWLRQPPREITLDSLAPVPDTLGAMNRLRGILHP